MIGYYNRRVLYKIINVKNIYYIGHKANVLILYYQSKINAKHQASQRNPHIFIFYTIIMNLSLILFLIGILGFVLNRKNIILMLISIEIMLLAITFLILVSSLSFDDILGQTYVTIYLAIIVLVLLGFAFELGKKALFIDSSLSRYEASFLLHSTLINSLQAPKIRHFATLTDVASNQYKPFDIIEIYLTKHELTNPEPFLSALEKVLIYDQYYSGVIGVIKRNDRCVPYIWREFYLHFNYSQIPTFASIIIDTIDIVDKTPSEVDVVLYLWPSASGGLPYPKGPSVRYIIDTHIIRYKGSFCKAIIYNDNSLASLYKAKQIKPIIGIAKYPFGMLRMSRMQRIRNFSTLNKISYRFQGNTHLKFNYMPTINLRMSGHQATDRYYLIKYFNKTLQPDIRYQVVVGYFESMYINNIILWRSFTFVNNEGGVIDLRNFFIENRRLYVKSPREVNVAIYIWPHQYVPTETNYNIDLYTVIKSPYLTKAKVIQEHKLYLYPMFDADLNFNNVKYPPLPHWYILFCRKIIRQFIIYPFTYILSILIIYWLLLVI